MAAYNAVKTTVNTVNYWKTLHKNIQKYTHIQKLYLNDGLLAVCKPFGIPVHSGPKVKFSMVDYFPKLEEQNDIPTGSLELCNRIDQHVSGVLLLSYTKDMAAYIADLQRRRLIEKEYLTVILGTLDHVYGVVKGDVVKTVVGGRHQQTVSIEATEECATTEYKILDNNKHTCMACSFQTNSGQTHQIRVHAARVMGCPILGDHKYHFGPRGPQPLTLRMMQLLKMHGVKPSKGRRGKKGREVIGRIRPWQRALLPLHLFANKVTIPGLGERKGKLEITAKMPDYFRMTMRNCDLRLNRHEMEEDAGDVKPQYPRPELMKESRLRSKGVNPKHVSKETIF